MSGLVLRVIEGVYGVWQLESGDQVPESGSSGIVSVTMTPDERSVVGLEKLAPCGARIEKGWRCLAVAGPLPFDLTGVLASIASPLAEAGVAIFVVSTYNTDYILVKEPDLEKAVRVLEEAGHTMRG